jgi:selenocysteine lyase/cysteine desulfurase
MPTSDFGPFAGRTWLNTAHQGPLPRPAVAAARDALADKAAPARIADDAFFELPQRLKRGLARLVGADPADVVLGNSTTYGLHLLAHGLPLQAGDEVLLVDGDFPASVTPWLALERRGIRVRLISPRSRPLSAAQLEAELSPRTRVFCSSWVFSFTGEAVDLAALGAVCRSAGVTFVVNGSQGVGARLIDVGSLSIDALVSCGFKWLCGPYATGFAWLRRELTERLDYRQAYWLSQMSGSDLANEMSYELRDDLGASEYDVFCTANFLNFAPWAAAVELLLDRGIEAVAEHDQRLVGRVVDGLADSEWELVSPAQQPDRSTLVLIRHRQPERTRRAFDALAAEGVDVALRGDCIRMSPHLHNSDADIDRALDVLTGVTQVVG